MIAFTVFGVASTMGSKRAFVPKGWTRPVITDSNKNLKMWQTLVAEAASHAIADHPDWKIIEGGVRLSLAFFLPRPKSLAKRVIAHTKAPDCSKLVRATEDALTGVVFVDDAQVIELLATKRYADVSASPHVHVRVEPTSGIGPVVVPAAPLPLFTEDD